MVTPPQSPVEEVRSPGSAASASQSAFIYPIKSAVSVKPPKPRNDTPSSQHPQDANAPTSPTASFRRQTSQGRLTKNVFDLQNPPPGRVRTPGSATLRELNDDDADAEESFATAIGGDSGLSSSAADDISSGEVMRRLRIGEGSDQPRPPAFKTHSSYDIATRMQRPPSVSASTAPSLGTASFQADQERLESMTLPRFKHIATENGHMVVTGREGEITRCEDEPIHIPGAVQSFGCMICVREDEEGCLVVRQCSENTGDILGLPPAYLFRLESFLDCLDDEQADILWDNIESLDHSQGELTESGPRIFQLSGRRLSKAGRHGAPWKTWCAAHAVPSKKVKPEDEGGQVQETALPAMTVLEFELVNDTINPINVKSRPSSPSGEESTDKESSSASNRSSDATTPPPSVTTIDSDGTTKISSAIATVGKVKGGLDGMPYVPTPEQFLESTQSTSKPLKALQRLKKEFPGKRERPRRRRGAQNRDSASQQKEADHGDDTLDMFGILSQVNEQFTAQSDLNGFLKVLVSLVRELTQFSRVMVYQFDEKWNGQVVCELVDWNDTHDLYRGLHFPATDIPKQARDLYLVNKIRSLYDRDQPSARMVCREKSDLETPIDMTHASLRAMSPIHIKYLANMGVRASMSISITAFDQLWGLIACHTYGSHGRRITFPMRQLCRLIGESVSRNIERLSYTRRLSARKLINTLPTDQNPSGYIISNAEDLLTLFDADFGVIAIGNEAKILGPLSASQEVLAVTEYLRIKKFQQVITSQDVASDFPDMVLPGGLEVIAGLMLIPLSSSGIDFITFLRKAQTQHVNWAGRPFKAGDEGKAVLEPRKSFKIWSETIVGTCRAWKDEELETASVLCLVYGKFISVWRQREQAVQYNQLNKLLLSNATHEVRTPLNHIINYLEMALDSPLDADTRENLSKSHMASKSLLFVINDLLDLTRHEEGNKLFLQEPFDLSATVREAVEMHEWEAKRRKIKFTLETSPEKCFVVGDALRVRQIVVNTVSNSVKYTDRGEIHVEMRKRTPEEITSELPEGCDMEIELSISDTGRGIAREKLEAIFREFEQVESVIADPNARRDDSINSAANADAQALTSMRQSAGEGKDSGIGLGLAIVARVVKNLGGQLRVDSTVGEGSRFTYYLPFHSSTAMHAAEHSNSESSKLGRSNSLESGDSNNSSVKSEINSLVEAISAPHLDDSRATPVRRSFDLTNNSSSRSLRNVSAARMDKKGGSHDGIVQVADSVVPLRSVKVDPYELDSVKESPKRGGRSRESTRDGAPSMSDRYTSGDTGQRAGPPPQISLPSTPEPHKPGQETPTSSEGHVVTSAADRRRARAKLISPSAGSSAPVKSEKLAHLRILVVEDDPVNRMILKKRLSMDGHTVSLAVNGEEGFRLFESDGHSIDVILMDLQMPICNGQDSCKRIRECEKKKIEAQQLADRPASHILNGRIPIFAVSATLDQSMRQEMCDIGMDGWLLKPIDFNRLRILLKGLTHLEARQKERWNSTSTWEKGGWLSDPASRPLEGADNPP